MNIHIPSILRPRPEASAAHMQAVLLFDGECPACSVFVRGLVRRDRGLRVRHSGHDGPSDATQYVDRLAFELAFMVQSTAPGSEAATMPPTTGGQLAAGARSARTLR